MRAPSGRMWYDPAMKERTVPEPPMPATDRFVLRDVLQTKAFRIDVADTPSGLGLGLWERRNGGHVAYHRPDHHTISLYLGGGYETREVVPGEHRPGMAGSPGAISIMPAGSKTLWDNRGFVRWMHLYFRDDHIAHATDGRVLDLPATTFACDSTTREMVQRFVLALDWHAEIDVLALDHALHAVLARLALRGTRGPEPARGGLTAIQFRRVEGIVHARLNERIALDQLADSVGLSVRQFSRAFAQTAGMPPYAWVLERRAEKARAMLANGEPAAMVAAACGFSSQSHMARRLRGSSS